MITLQSHVCGRWETGSGSAKDLFNPATEEVLGSVHQGGIDLGAALQYARAKGIPALRALGFQGRAALLKSLSAAIHEARDELIEIATRNGGNTRGDAKFDLDGATGTLAYYAQLGASLPAGNLLPDGDGIQLGRTPRFWGQHVHAPRPGVAVHINAFNFPAWGMAEKMACALLAGVPVIEKAGTPSAMLAHRIAQILVEKQLLPEGAFQFVAGSVSPLLDQLGAMDAVAFTGSAATGALIRGNRNLVARNVRVNIEADSVNAAVLGADAEVGSDTFEQFLNNVTTDMTQKAGQKCTAVRRILLPADRVDEVGTLLCERLAAVKVGDPADGDVRMGPVASREQLADVRAGMTALMAVGKALCGGPAPIAAKGYFVAPTLLCATDVRAEVIHSLEVFGPCATLLPTDGTAEQAVELCNRGGGGLVASVYSDDRAFVETVVAGISPWHGRIWLGSEKTQGQALGPGAVLPATIHGGPGRAGGGEELGGLRGLAPYLQRTAVQGDRAVVARAFGLEAPAATSS